MSEYLDSATFVLNDTRTISVLPKMDSNVEYLNLAPPKKKISSQNEKWATTAKNNSTKECQINLLTKLRSCSTIPKNGEDAILFSQLKIKQTGYRSQDNLKELYDPTKFVDIGDIIKLLVDSDLSCFYCKKWTPLFYENVRDPTQWSLERISNSEGHNRDNVVIACLECNMRRRTMYYERYVATKQLKVIKLDTVDVFNELDNEK